MVAEVRASAAKLTQRDELVSQLQTELRRANVQIKELLDITNGSIPSTRDGSASSKPIAERLATQTHKTDRSWKQLAHQVESMNGEHVDNGDSSAPASVLLSDCLLYTSPSPRDS